MKRLAIVVTHPIQYYTPVFKLLAKETDVMVFYTWGEASMTKYDPGFGKTIKWDIDLLEGYNYQWADNVAADPGTHNFNGIDTPGLNEQIKAWQPDTVLVYGWAFKSHLSVLRYFKNKIPVLFRGDSVLLNKQKGLKNLLRSVYLKWVYKHIDYALYVGTNNKAYFKKYGLKDSQLIFAPHAIDNKRFSTPDPAGAQELRSSLNLKESDILILYAGKFEQVKSLDVFVSAFIKLAAPNLHLLLVGNGPDEEKLRSLAANSTVANNIHFSGFVNQSVIPAIYQSADLYCLPSISETWGLAVNEAMACGKAILVSDKVGCAADLVKADYNGAIFEAGSLSSLTDKLAGLVDKGKSGLAEMGRNSNKIIQDWTFEAQVDHIINYKDGRKQ